MDDPGKADSRASAEPPRAADTPAKPPRVASKRRSPLAPSVDPVATRSRDDAQRQRIDGQNRLTFAQAADEVHKTQAKGFKNAMDAAQWILILKSYAFPKIGETPVGEIDAAVVLSVLQPIWTTKAETARKVRQRIDAVMRWAVAHNHATVNPVAAAVELLPKQSDDVEHHQALKPSDVPNFLRSIRRAEAQPSVRLALEFLTLTAARSGEVREARWREVDFDAQLWTIPGERMKAGKEHQVPLSDRAVEILEAAAPKADRDPGALIFPDPKADKSLTDMMLLKLMKLHAGEAVPQGLRSTFRDWCSEAGISREIVEGALAQAVGDETEAAHLRTKLLEQRRPVMQAWANAAQGKSKTAAKPTTKGRGSR